jgi:hypothetical protein
MRALPLCNRLLEILNAEMAAGGCGTGELLGEDLLPNSRERQVKTRSRQSVTAVR